MRLLARTLPLCLLFTAGCKTCELVEAELRYQTDRVYSLEAEVAQKDAEIQALRSTYEIVQIEPAQPGAIPPEVIFQQQGLSRISFGTTTGGRDDDRDGADESLQAVITPHDIDGDPFKCPGTAELEVHEFLPSGGKRQLGLWALDQSYLRNCWRSTVLAQGYVVVVPWKERPTEPRLRLVARFTTLDGRTFECEKDIQISPPKAGKILPLSPAPSQVPPASLPASPPPTTILPTPAPVDELPRPQPSEQAELPAPKPVASKPRTSAALAAMEKKAEAPPSSQAPIKPVSRSARKKPDSSESAESATQSTARSPFTRWRNWKSAPAEVKKADSKQPKSKETAPPASPKVADEPVEPEKKPDQAEEEQRNTVETDTSPIQATSNSARSVVVGKRREESGAEAEPPAIKETEGRLATLKQPGKAIETDKPIQAPSPSKGSEKLPETKKATPPVPTDADVTKTSAWTPVEESDFDAATSMPLKGSKPESRKKQVSIATARRPLGTAPERLPILGGDVPSRPADSSDRNPAEPVKSITELSRRAVQTSTVNGASAVVPGSSRASSTQAANAIDSRNAENAPDLTFVPDGQKIVTSKIASMSLQQVEKPMAPPRREKAVEIIAQSKIAPLELPPPPAVASEPMAPKVASTAKPSTIENVPANIPTGLGDEPKLLRPIPIATLQSVSD